MELRKERSRTRKLYYALKNLNEKFCNILFSEWKNKDTITESWLQGNKKLNEETVIQSQEHEWES